MWEKAWERSRMDCWEVEDDSGRGRRVLNIVVDDDDDDDDDDASLSLLLFGSVVDCK